MHYTFFTVFLPTIPKSLMAGRYDSYCGDGGLSSRMQSLCVLAEKAGPFVPICFGFHYQRSRDRCKEASVKHKWQLVLFFQCLCKCSRGTLVDIIDSTVCWSSCASWRLFFFEFCSMFLVQHVTLARQIPFHERKIAPGNGRLPLVPTQWLQTCTELMADLNLNSSLPNQRPDIWPASHTDSQHSPPFSSIQE